MPAYMFANHLDGLGMFSSTQFQGLHNLNGPVNGKRIEIEIQRLPRYKRML
jgi:hypothetical protein